MIYDLHTHTTCSDGKYSRLELLKKANDFKFQYLSFADHNYVSNDIDELNSLYVDKYHSLQKVKLILATELDISEYSRLHILGYDMKNIDKLKIVLKQLEMENTDICRELVAKIKMKYNITIPFEELESMTVNGNVTKNVVVQWLIDNGFAKNVFEAGMLYTSKYSPCYVKRSTLSLNDAINLIKDADGLVVMAHPSSMKLSNEELYKFIKKLKKIGLDGIEVFNADKTTVEQLQFYKQIALELSLLQTSGSDFHRETETPIFGVNNDYSNNFLMKVKGRRK